MKILGLDPGMTTGWAVAEVTETRSWGYRWVKTGDVKYKQFNAFVYKAIGHVDLVVCEDFVIRTNVKSWNATRLTDNNLEIKGMVGRVEAFCWLHKKPLVKYEAKEKRLGYTLNGMKYEPNSKKQARHQHDAMAHVRLVMRRKFDI